MPLWHRMIVFGAVLIATLIAARIVDRRLARSDLPAATVTRYRVLRRTVLTLIVFVGLLSGLLVIPQVRAVATAILASSAVVGIVVGFAAQRTIGNFIAGLLIAFAQPIRLGDYVETEGFTGVVEEIGLTYTFIRISDNDRLVVPNEKLASQTIRNSTIRSSETFAEATVQVPAANLRETVASLADMAEQVYVTDLSGDKATVVVRKRVSGEGVAERAASDLRIALAERLSGTLVT
jgi:small-conductance mechanosensitive channel